MLFAIGVMILCRVGSSILKLFEHHSQTNFPIIKTKPFNVAKYKKGWQIFRPKWVKIKIVVIYFIFVIKKCERESFESDRDRGARII